MSDVRYLTTMLTALAMACLLALSLWPDAGCRGCGADVLRDAVLLRAR